MATPTTPHSQFMLDLLNSGIDPNEVARRTNQQYGLQHGGEAVYYGDSQTIGMPEYYLAKNPDGSWGYVQRATGGPAAQTGPMPVNTFTPTQHTPYNPVDYTGGRINPQGTASDDPNKPIGSGVYEAPGWKAKAIPAPPPVPGSARPGVPGDLDTIVRQRLVDLLGNPQSRDLLR